MSKRITVTSAAETPRGREVNNSSKTDVKRNHPGKGSKTKETILKDHFNASFNTKTKAASSLEYMLAVSAVATGVFSIVLCCYRYLTSLPHPSCSTCCSLTGFSVASGVKTHRAAIKTQIREKPTSAHLPHPGFTSFCLIFRYFGPFEHFVSRTCGSHRHVRACPDLRNPYVTMRLPVVAFPASLRYQRRPAQPLFEPKSIIPTPGRVSKGCQT